MERYFNQNKGITLIVLTAIIVGVIVITGATGAAFFYLNNNIIVSKNDATNSLEEENTYPIIEEKKDSNNNAELTNTTEEIESEPIFSSPSSNLTNPSSITNTYNGYNVVGKIEIPKTKVNYPILEKVTKASIETAVAVLYGPGPNKVGNTVIVGHNYNDGQFFSNNKSLANGDKIYITDANGNRITYTIYDKYETAPEDTSFYTRDTNGAVEITLSTSTDNQQNRLIILAKAEWGISLILLLTINGNNKFPFYYCHFYFEIF